ncbi:MAG: ParB/RepB/Spo0J family partition protein [Cyanobacteria bacterium P01_G01_bin.19]
MDRELLRTTFVSPSSLIPRQNSREMTKSRVNSLRKKIRKYGYDADKPIEVAEVDGKLVIIDGHHRYQASVRERLAEVPIEVYKVSSETQKEYLEDTAEARGYSEDSF